MISGFLATLAIALAVLFEAAIIIPLLEPKRKAAHRDGKLHSEAKALRKTAEILLHRAAVLERYASTVSVSGKF